VCVAYVSLCRDYDSLAKLSLDLFGMVIQLGTPEVKFHDKGHKSVFTNTGEINARKSFSACKFTLDAKKWSAENRPEMETVNVTKWSV